MSTGTKEKTVYVVLSLFSTTHTGVQLFLLSKGSRTTPARSWRKELSEDIANSYMNLYMVRINKLRMKKIKIIKNLIAKPTSSRFFQERTTAFGLSLLQELKMISFILKLVVEVSMKQQHPQY